MRTETPDERRARLREAQRVLDEQPPLPPEEQAFVDRRRAELREMVARELERRRLTACRRGANKSAMGTNFYLEYKMRPAAPFTIEPIHIGKSAFGWAFALHIYPDDDVLPKSFADWSALLERDDVFITNEYGDTVSPADMIDTIRRRPDGLRRCPIDGDHCVGHGDSWDLMVGEFF